MHINSADIVRPSVSAMDEKLLLDTEGSPLEQEYNKDNKQGPRWQEPIITKRSWRQSLLTTTWAVCNVFATVALVFTNKFVFSDPQLKKCQMTIGAWHFAMTAVVLSTAATMFGTFPMVRVPIRSLLPISCFFSGFLLLGNLSLTLNTLGFYQIAKVMTTPAVVFLNFLLFGITITKISLLAVVAVCAGVLQILKTGAADNVLGTLVAVAAFMVTALYQIWIGKKMTDLDVTACQLLSNIAPVGTIVLLVLATVMDTAPDLSTIPQDTLYMLVISGVLASALNLSQFMIIERSSTLTFNVISQLKTVIIVMLGWYSESKNITIPDVLGLVITLTGAFVYAYSGSTRRRQK